MSENKFTPKKLKDIIEKPAKKNHEYKGNTDDERAIVANLDANTVRHPDRNGNGDDVFKGANLKRDKKHVEPGKDEKNYDEWNNVKEAKTDYELQDAVRRHTAGAFKNMDIRTKAAKLGDEETAEAAHKKATRHLGIAQALYKKYPQLK